MRLSLGFWFLLVKRKVRCGIDCLERQVWRVLCAESDSENEWLLMIQTTPSYSINPRKWKHIVWHHSIPIGDFPLTEQIHTVETSSALSVTRRERKVSRRKEVLSHLLLKAIDEELKHVFREEGVSVVYDFIENKCHLKREKIVEKPEVFSAGLYRLLVSMAPVIEKMVLENLFSKLGLRFEKKEGYEFSDYIRELKGKVRLINE